MKLFIHKILKKSMKEGFVMDGELRRNMLAELDKYVLEKQMSNFEIKIAEVIKPELERLSQKNNVDIVDLFVAYMDHVAKTSRAMTGENNNVDLEKPDFKLY